MRIGFATLGLRFDGGSLDREGIGGSETALICVARELAKRGHEVEVYCLCSRPNIYDGVRYHDIGIGQLSRLHLAAKGEAGIREFDVIFVSRFWQLAHSPLPAKVVIGWAHDVAEKDVLLPALWQMDRLICLSRFQEELFVGVAGEKIRGMIHRSRNGVDLDMVRPNIEPKRRGKLIYTSRPERGLYYLLRDIFPKLLEKRPDLTLHLCAYETPGLKIPEAIEVVRAACDDLIAKLGDRVVRHGALTKRRLYQEMSSAQCWVYPCSFPEISCIGALEAQACGTAVVCTDGFALSETAGGHACVRILGRPGELAYTAAFVDAVLATLDQEDYELAPSSLGEPWVRDHGYTWGDVARDFEELVMSRWPVRCGLQTVAACMIVKNEEDDLARCLNHVRPWVDELHVVDTGSTDRTLEIARQFEPTTLRSIASVEESGFAAARNESIRDVTADWILWIDADEVLIGGDHLRKFLHTSYFEGYAIDHCHLQIDQGMTVDQPIRLFRRRRQYRFTGLIHEHAEDLSRGPFDKQIEPVLYLPDVKLAHFGYAAEAVRREKVSNRNMPLLRRSLREEPDRQLSWALALRDLVNIAAWSSERSGTIACGSIEHACLCRCVIEFESRFSDAGVRYHAMTYPFYQDALRLLGTNNLPAPGRENPPFEVAFGMASKPGGIDGDSSRLEGRARWHADVASFGRFLAAKAEQLAEAIIARPAGPAPDDIPSAADLLSAGQTIYPQQYVKSGRHQTHQTQRRLQ